MREKAGGQMPSWSNIIIALCAVALVLTACASPDLLEPRAPGLLSQFANKSLSPTKTKKTRESRTAYASGGARSGRYERYPGDPGIVPIKHDFSGAEKRSNGYELNFNNAELSELATVVLKDTLEVPFVFDPRVSGRVTLSTGRPVPRNELLRVLEAVLSMNRAALVKDGDIYKILPIAEARLAGSSSIDYIAERKAIGPGYGISIFPLDHVSAQAMLQTLQSFVTKRNALRASASENILILRGDSQSRRSLLEVAAMFDVDWMRGQSAGIYVLKDASPGQLIPELERVFQTRNGRGKGLVRFQAINRMNAILALTGKAARLDQVALWVRRLDRTGTEAEGFYVYKVEHGKAQDLAAVLNETFSGGSGGGVVRPAEEDSIAPDRTVSTVSSAEADDSDQSSAGAPRASPSSTSAISASSNSGGSTSTGIRIIPDNINNKLLIKASSRDYRHILGILRKIDQPQLQVLINTTLVEVTLNDKLQYGVQFFLQKDGGRNGALGFSNGSSINISPSVPGLNFIIGSIVDPKVVIDALALETAVKVVSSPSLVVVNNQSATLQVGDEVPIATRSATSVTDPEAPVVNEIQFRDTGVILKVKPRVNSNGVVTMEIEQEISAVSATTAVGDTGTLTPTISQRRISSTIAVNSGQTVVLGGLISEQFDSDKSRVPLLRKVPYIGKVIGGTVRSKSRTELIVFLQPVVIRNAQDASNVAVALRAGLQSMAPRPLPRATVPNSADGRTSRSTYKR